MTAKLKTEYVLFTKRTNQPKLGWLIKKCKKAGLRVRIDGSSFHAPCSWVHPADESSAWEILGPVDNVADNNRRFVEGK